MVVIDSPNRITNMNSGDRAAAGEVEQVLAPAELEHGHDDAVGGRDRQQVARLGGDHEQAPAARNPKVSTKPNTSGSDLGRSPPSDP